MENESFSKFALRVSKYDRKSFLDEHPEPFIIVDTFDPLLDEPITSTSTDDTKDSAGMTIEEVLAQNNKLEFSATCQVAVLSITDPTGRFVIGRHIESDLPIEHSRISRFHVAMKRGEENEWLIADLDSANGTFMDRTPLEPHTFTPLKMGVRITLSKLITFWVLESAELWDEAKAHMEKWDWMYGKKKPS